MAEQTGKTEQAKAEKKWWCNFCDFRTDDEKEYLAHSCKDELARRAEEEKRA
jgi:hypothetical protein